MRSALALALALAVEPLAPPLALATDEQPLPLAIECRRVGTPECKELRTQSIRNVDVKKFDKGAKQVLDTGLKLAEQAADPETQKTDPEALSRAEERFTLLIEEVAPEYTGGYNNRANVRVAQRRYSDAVDDYNRAIALAPLSDDIWVQYLNRGSTLLEMGRKEDALRDLRWAVTLAKGDSTGEQYTLLKRGDIYHTLGSYGQAAADLGEVYNRKPGTPEPFWLRYALDLGETGQRAEALGIARRLTAKFDIEPESNLCVCALLWRDGAGPGSDADREEALRRWSTLPVPSKQTAARLDLQARAWPPKAREAAAGFLEDVGAQQLAADAAPASADASS